MLNDVKSAAKYILSKTEVKVEIGLVLGSGLGVLADEIEEATIIPYEEIPHFPRSTVEGHKGQLVIGDLNGKKVIAMQGRFHYYEGYPLQEVTFPIRVMKELGVEHLIVTNAAGGLNESFQAGDLMVITDHINLFGHNPLIGENVAEWGERFPDMSNAYHKELIHLVKNSAKQLNIPIKEGVYVGVTGPSYETPSEVKMLRHIGGDAVGMSTVPEVIVANHARMKVIGISCISNMAAGILDEPLSHDDVIKQTEKVKKDFVTLVKHVVISI